MNAMYSTCAVHVKCLHTFPWAPAILQNASEEPDKKNKQKRYMYIVYIHTVRISKNITLSN